METRLETTFPAFIDATMRAEFTECPQRFYNGYIQKLKSKGQNVHLLFGSAWAKALEETRKAFYVDKLSVEDSIKLGHEAGLREYGNFQPPTDSKKPPSRLLEGLVGYFDEWEPSSDYLQPIILNEAGAAGIEFTFAVDLPIRHPETGDPILYVGRFDMLAKRQGSLIVVDDKTCSQLGNYWADQWYLRAQLIGYQWAASQYFDGVLGSIVRGACFYKDSIKFAEAVQIRPNFLIKNWYDQLLKDINRMIECWRSGTWDYAFNNACTVYGGCPYQRLCTAADPSVWYDVDYVRDSWNPLRS